MPEATAQRSKTPLTFLFLAALLIAIPLVFAQAGRGGGGQGGRRSSPSRRSSRPGAPLRRVEPLRQRRLRAEAAARRAPRQAPEALRPSILRVPGSPS